MEFGRDKKPLLRIVDAGPEFRAPCRNEKGCPKGSPEQPRSLNEMNSQAYDHYRECQAIGRFPDDPIVKRNAAIIRGVEDSAERSREIDFQSMMMQLVGLL